MDDDGMSVPAYFTYAPYAVFHVKYSKPLLLTYFQCAVTRLSRLVTEECMKWANQRLVYGKKLMDQPVIRQKLAKMIAHCEADQAWLENITYQMCNMTYKQQSQNLAGPVGLLKMFATRSAHEIAD